MFLFRRRRDASVRVLQPLKSASDREKSENIVENSAVNVTVPEIQPLKVNDDTAKKISKKIQLENDDKKGTNNKKTKENKRRFYVKKEQLTMVKDKKPKEKALELIDKGIKSQKPEEDKDLDVSVQVITAEDLKKDTGEDGMFPVDMQAEINVSDDIADSLLVPVNKNKKLTDKISGTKPELGISTVEETTNRSKEVDEKEVESPAEIVSNAATDEIPAAPEIKSEFPDAKKKEEASSEKTEEGGNLFSALFGQTEVIEETPLDQLIKSLPEISIDEILNEAEDVKSIIHDWYQQKINRY